MKQEKISREFAALPPELQRQVIDFIAFLRSRHPDTKLNATVKRSKLADEPFIGMWRNRKDLRDSTAWVREIRNREWMSRDG